MNRFIPLLCLLAVVCGLAGVSPADDDTALLYGQRVEEAIARAQQYLLKEQEKDGNWVPNYKAWNHTYPVGPTAAVTYALLQSGVHPEDEQMVKALQWLVEQETDQTYEVAFRALALASTHKITRGKYRRHLERDINLLVG